jgi:hypothetical protein
MKRRFGILSLILVLAFLAVPSNSAAHVWATGVKWSPGDLNGDSSGLGHDKIGMDRYVVAEALGAHQPGSDDIDFLSLGLGGFAVFDFGVGFQDATVTYETTFNDRDGYPEKARVYGVGFGFDYDGPDVDGYGVMSSPPDLSDTNLFTPLGVVDNADDAGVFELTFETGPYRYLVLEDVTDSGPSFDGFDVDAVAVTPVPLPGAAWLLGFGLVAMVGLRRKTAAR